MKIFQSTELSRHPIAEMEAATKQYVDQQITGTAVTGGLFFTDISPTSTGIVGSKQYVSGTIPVNKVIAQATTDTDNVRVTMFAEGGSSFYSPTVTITTIPPQPGGAITATLVEDPADKRAYTATADIVVTVDTTVLASSSTNATASATVIRAGAGPAIDFLQIGPYPGAQTEVKAGDLVTVSGRAPNDATYAELIAGGANAGLLVLTLGAPDSFSTGYKTLSGTFTVSSLSGAQTVSARARNALGTFGATFVSINSIILNQTYPTIGARTITYPLGQQGLKDSESATISATITNFDTVTYSGVNLSVTDPTTYAVSKTVTRTGGTYVYGTNNYTITATRAANAATSTAQAAVTIADTAPTAAVTISGSPARLRSSPAGIDYTITLTASQRLLSAPVLTASSGTWIGSWSGGPTIWTRTLRIQDADPKGPQTFSSLQATGLAGVVGTIITSGANYTVGGFPVRTLVFPAFAQYVPIGTSVVDFSKTRATYTGVTPDLTRRTDTNFFFQGFTITDSGGVYNPTGDHLFITDSDFAGANTTGTLQVDVEELP